MSNRIVGHSAPAPRLTPLGAAILAAVLALPGGALIGLAATIAS